jgi:hypothetical protein
MGGNYHNARFVPAAAVGATAAVPRDHHTRDPLGERRILKTRSQMGSISNIRLHAALQMLQFMLSRHIKAAEHPHTSQTLQC